MRLRHKANAIPRMQESKYIIFDPENHKGKWKELFRDDKPIALEIGAGRVILFLARQALILPIII